MNNVNNIRQLIDIVEGLQSTPANITVEPLEDGYGEQITVRITELDVPLDNVEITVDRDSNITGKLIGDYLYAEISGYYDSVNIDGEVSDDDTIKRAEQELQDDPSITIHFQMDSDGTLLDNVEEDEDDLRDTVARIHSSTGTNTDILYDMIGVDYIEAMDDIKTVFEYLKNTIGTTYDKIYHHVSAPPDSLLGIE